MKTQPKPTWTPLMYKAFRHWKEFRPKMVRRLDRSGMLEKALERADENARNLINANEDRGFMPEEAREAAIRAFITLPDEADEPTLDADQDPYQPWPTTETESW